MEILTTIVKWIPKSLRKTYKTKGACMTSTMTPSRPYLVNAMLKWILDNNMIPLLIVNINEENIEAPLQYFDQNADVIFDISEQACYDLNVSDDTVIFYAQFGEDAIDHKICLPMKAILGIYAEESGKGMRFTDNNEYDGMETIDTTSSVRKLPSYLEVVK